MQDKLFILPSRRAAGTEQVVTSNLPGLLTLLIGREQEAAAVCALLRRPEVRLLTFTGAGGVGKTRLGLQVATDLFNDFFDGACFVSLAPISDPNLVPDAIAQALDLKQVGEQPPPRDLLKAFLREKQLLLLLDNFEQVVTAAPALADLLAACPGLKALVTSRTVLRISGEYEFPVPPLALPDLKQLPESASLAEYAAVALFLQRAQAVKPDFQITPSNARAISEICVRLDGLPLAIELAAARIKLLPPQALSARLSQRLAILTSGPKDAPERQQTLRNTLAWSYDLLNVAEQRLFWQLSVFVDGCSLEAVEVVCTAPGDGSGARAVLDTVASLIDKSLLQQTEPEGEEPRLMMLETIREFGLETLAESGETEVTRYAHANYYLALAEEAEQELDGPKQVMWLERLEREHDNLRAALQWSIEQGETGHSTENIEAALRLAGALREFWMGHGYYSEGRAFLERALAQSKGVVAAVRAKALNAAVEIVNLQGDSDLAAALCEESLTLYRELGDKQGIAFLLYQLGCLTWDRGNAAAARSLIEEALARWKEMGDKKGIAWSLFQLAQMFLRQGEYTRAHAFFGESLTIHRELGNKRDIAYSLFQLAQVLLEAQGDPTAIRSLFNEGLALFEELGNKWGIAASFYLSGKLALAEGDTVTASSLLEKSVVLTREMGNQEGLAESLLAFAWVRAVQGNHTAARSLYEESLALARKVDARVSIASGLEGLAGVVAAQGEPVWAARLWGAADSLRQAIAAPLPPVERARYEQEVTAARTQLGEKRFAAAWSQGGIMTIEQVLAAQGLVMMPEQVPSGLPMVTKTPSPTHPAGLTLREVDVLRLVAQGLTDAKVAETLVISPRTVNWHLTSIYSKLQVSSRSAATRYAIEQKLI